jgi:uncharacterized protein
MNAGSTSLPTLDEWPVTCRRAGETHRTAAGNREIEVWGTGQMITDVKKLPIQFDRDRVVAFCRDRGVVRLSVFGSVLRDDFDPAHSDIDVLADFKPEATRGVGFRFFGYGDELAEILGGKVDFCSRLDPRVEPTVRREAVTIYEES